MKSKTTAIILSALCGGLGIDRFYLGYTGMGVLKLLTGGCFGILWILDIAHIANGQLQPADGSHYQEDVQMQMIMQNANTAVNQTSNINVVDELKKYKELQEQGVISVEEYEAKKEQFLKLM